MFPSAKSLHIRMDNMAPLSYSTKMERTQNKSLTLLFKEIWEYLIAKEIMVAVEYLGGSLNQEVDFQSRTVTTGFSLHELEIGSILQGERCFPKFMGSYEKLYLSSIFTSRLCFQ